MHTILTEPFVKSSIEKYLSKDWKFEPTRLREHGVDIKAKHKKCGWYWLIETKGDPGSKVKTPSGSRNVDLKTAIGQIISRMHTNRKQRLYKYGYRYGLGFPISYKKIALRDIPYDVCDKLNLYLFFVDDKGRVEVYDWKKVKKIQTAKLVNIK